LTVVQPASSDALSGWWKFSAAVAFSARDSAVDIMRVAFNISEPRCRTETSAEAICRMNVSVAICQALV
jgi:hypothetical protein